MNKLNLEEGGFDPPTSGFWAQDASSASLYWFYNYHNFKEIRMLKHV